MLSLCAKSFTYYASLCARPFGLAVVTMATTAAAAAAVATMAVCVEGPLVEPTRPKCVSLVIPLCWLLSGSFLQRVKEWGLKTKHVSGSGVRHKAQQSICLDAFFFTWPRVLTERRGFRVCMPIFCGFYFQRTDIQGREYLLAHVACVHVARHLKSIWWRGGGR